MSAVADPSRITELEARIARDPASIAFAQLAEEYRRDGRLDDAVRVCRDGLAQHPDYPSARLTLGRALVEQGHPDQARAEFERVAREGPDNLAAVRAIEELRRLGVEMGGGESEPAAADDAALAELDGWLSALTADRAARSSSGGGSGSGESE